MQANSTHVFHSQVLQNSLFQILKPMLLLQLDLPRVVGLGLRILILLLLSLLIILLLLSFWRFIKAVINRRSLSFFFGTRFLPLLLRQSSFKIDRVLLNIFWIVQRLRLHKLVLLIQTCLFLESRVLIEGAARGAKFHLGAIRGSFSS